jgi:hypothetical protein
MYFASLAAHKYTPTHTHAYIKKSEKENVSGAKMFFFFFSNNEESKTETIKNKKKKITYAPSVSACAPYEGCSTF